MKSMRFDVSQFREDAGHFPRTELLLAVKSFDLQAIQKRYLDSRSRSKTGSVERRHPTQGGVVHIIVDNGKIVQNRVIATLTEPRGVDFTKGYAAVSSEDKVFLFQIGENHPNVIEHPWLSYIHTVRFNKDRSRVLVTSSGLDTILEFDTSSGECLWEWFAWDHGINEGKNPRSNESFTLTRHAEEASRIEAMGKKVLLISDPRKQAIPTALRAAFINTAEYDGNGGILATLFHAGEVIVISTAACSWRRIIDGLNKPHGGMIYEDGYMVTDTGGGRVVFMTEEECLSYDYSKLPGKSGLLEKLEWLQTSRHRYQMIATIDSNRHSLIFLDTQAKKRTQVEYDPNWAIQELAFLEDASRPMLSAMESWFEKNINESDRNT